MMWYFGSDDRQNWQFCPQAQGSDIRIGLILTNRFRYQHYPKRGVDMQIWKDSRTGHFEKEMKTLISFDISNGMKVLCPERIFVHPQGQFLQHKFNIKNPIRCRLSSFVKFCQVLSSRIIPDKRQQQNSIIPMYDMAIRFVSYSMSQIYLYLPITPQYLSSDHSNPIKCLVW